MAEINKFDTLSEENEVRDIHAEIAQLDEIKRQIAELSTIPTQCRQPSEINIRPLISIPGNAIALTSSNQNSLQRDDVDFCEACDRLDEADNLFINGMSAEECAALFNNRGLDINTAGSNCEALQDLVDCLIGQHKKTLDITNFCDIKDWLEQLMANIWNVKSALVCDSCGQWNQIRLLWIQVREIWQQMHDVWAELRRITTEILELIECVRTELHDRITREVARLDRRIDETNTRIDETNVRITNEVTRIDERINATNLRVTNLETENLENRRILSAILAQMRQVNAWSDSGQITSGTPDLRGLPSANVNLAAGNINLFGNASGSRYIRTNQIANNPQDIRGGLN